jgi:PTH1 family peptidyl-tRNA hydrolase
MILVGLRNPGKKYEKTRHNAGAIVLGYLVKESGNMFEQDKFSNCEKTKINLGESVAEVYLPNTFMNLSGESVYKILKRKEKGEKMFVFFDDVTIPVGQYKISVGEGASSHNGIRSIIENIKSLGLTKDHFVRVRIGVGRMIKELNENSKETGKEKLYEPEPEKLSDFVLSNLNNLEFSVLKSLTEKIIQRITL